MKNALKSLALAALLSPAFSQAEVVKLNAEQLVADAKPEAAPLASPSRVYDAATTAELKRLSSLPNVEFSFREQPVHTCILAIADGAAMSYIAPNAADFAAPVTMRFIGNPYLALQTLAEDHGFEMEFKNNAWRFTPVSVTQLVTRNYKIKYNDGATVKLTPGNINSSIGGASGSGGSTGGNSGGSSGGAAVTAGTIEANVRAIEAEIQALFKLPVTGYGLALEDGGSAADGFKTSVVSSNEGSGKGTVVSNCYVRYFPDTGVLQVVAPNQTQRRVEAFLANQDRRQDHIQISTTFVEIKKVKDNNFGTDWSGAGNVSATISGLSSGPIDWDHGSKTPYPANSVVSMSDMKWVFKFIRENTESTTFQNPTVTTTNNREIQVDATVEEPIQSATSNSVTGAGTNTQGSITYLPIGTTLKILPQAMDADPSIGDGTSRNVKLNVVISVSEKIGTRVIDGREYPIRSPKNYTSTVIVPNDYTLCIAGLRKTNNEEVETKVPVLGDIPYLGVLFKSKSSVKNDSNLVAFVTPHIITKDDFDSKSGAEKMLTKRDATAAARTSMSGVTGYHNWSENRDAILLPDEVALYRSPAEKAAAEKVLADNKVNAHTALVELVDAKRTDLSPEARAKLVFDLEGKPFFAEAVSPVSKAKDGASKQGDEMTTDFGNEKPAAATVSLTCKSKDDFKAAFAGEIPMPEGVAAPAEKAAATGTAPASVNADDSAAAAREAGIRAAAKTEMEAEIAREIEAARVRRKEQQQAPAPVAPVAPAKAMAL